VEVNDFSAIRISLASPEEIRSWSYGEVTKPETINYRTLRPERDGLFCERIFGPTKDWECYCGKYKRVRYKGVTCEKCGVEVAPARVRRERMGHIELASPVSHIWYVKGVPSRLGLLLDITPRNLERVLYFAQYIISHIDEDARRRALARLEKEYSLKAERSREEGAGRIEAIEAGRDEELSRIAEEETRQYQALEEQLAARTDEVMTEARVLQSELEEKLGKKPPASRSLSFAPDPLVGEGEIISAEHLARLNQLVQDRLNQIEEKVRQGQAEAQQSTEARREEVRYTAQAAVEAIQAEIDEQIAAMRDEIQADIDDLRSLREQELISEARYREIEERWGQIVTAGMGAEAVHELLENMDLDAMAKELRAEVRTTRSKQRRKKAAKRLRVVEAFRRSVNHPEWMILTVLPVIPPELRPMVQLDGGRFATSDLNDLYRRVINRNNRLRRLLELGAPDVIVRNEKRMLQEAVDSLIDNGRRGRAVSRSGRRKLKSLSDMLKGKQGRFRRNLLGKRVDYSGRSVIVIGPELALHQCGLPKRMALELFKPFVMRCLVEHNFAHNIKSAKRMVDRLSPEVWDVLEAITKERPVLLNRAPTLHRLGIQAFEVVLIEGSAIQIHPLVCSAFNADFDGDQMAVHVPLSQKAVEEARQLMLSSSNLLKPASGEPVVGPTKDMVMGCHYLTVKREGVKGEGKIFAGFNEVALAYELDLVDLHAAIKVRPTEDDVPGAAPGRKGAPGEEELLETTVGRVLFNLQLPSTLRFVNEVMDKKALNELVARCYDKMGLEETAGLVDEIKRIGFTYATRSGISIAVSDISVPEAKKLILDEATDKVEEIERQFRRGLITEEEQYVKTVELWTRATEDITRAVAEKLDPNHGIGAMAASGATKGGIQPIRQLAGMRGLMADPSGRIIALPIRSNFREGLSALEYFLSTHGARKGLADTALRTADAGYLTRRLVDVAQDVIVVELDCGVKGGVWVDVEGALRIGERLRERIVGRVAAADIVAPGNGQLILSKGEMISDEIAEIVEAEQIERVHVHSPLSCQAPYGLCAKCYGRDLARGGMVKVGEAVGIIAAQSIGEPGTQLTLRTFHTGGVVGTEDITQGLPRVEELFEARIPKGEALIADVDGIINLAWEGDQRKLKLISSRPMHVEHPITPEFEPAVEDGSTVAVGTVLATGPDGKERIISQVAGQVFFEDGLVVVRYEDREEVDYEVPSAARLKVEVGSEVKAGQQLTEGALNPREILRIMGRDATQTYLLEEIQKVYRSQGVNINDKHIEVIIRQMLRKVRVRSAGDTEFLPGELIDRFIFEVANETALAGGKRPATGQTVLLGLTKAALATESFLAAASFQETTRVLTEAAVRGRRDELRGLKENVIIGKLIPVGTGFRYKEKGKGEYFSSVEMDGEEVEAEEAILE
jgi:DNA-directed RNA polymerase subunit beta'